jgi:hypothetical protein
VAKSRVVIEVRRHSRIGTITKMKDTLGKSRISMHLR